MNTAQKQLKQLAELDKEILMWKEKFESHKRANPTIITLSTPTESYNGVQRLITSLSRRS